MATVRTELRSKNLRRTKSVHMQHGGSKVMFLISFYYKQVTINNTRLGYSHICSLFFDVVVISVEETIIAAV